MAKTPSKSTDTNRPHAVLSASGAERWFGCPGSISAEASYPDKSSPFAEEGTRAHEVADMCLKQGVDAQEFLGKELLGGVVDKEMVVNVQEYVDYVLSFETADTKLFTEQKVNFSNYVPKGFGTLDSAVMDYANKVCHIFDLKYGRGTPVEAFENKQGMLYALGFLNDWEALFDIKDFVIHIVQPRNPIGTTYYEISVKDLKAFGAKATERASLAMSKDAPRLPGESQCKFCKAKGDCPALATFVQNTLANDFQDLTVEKAEGLSDTQKRNILENSKLIESFIDAVKDSVYQKMIEGESFEGFKLVEGRSVSKWTDEAEEELVKLLGDNAHEKKLIGITAAKKLLKGDEIEGLTVKPRGKLTIAPTSDKRQPVVVADFLAEFDDVSGGDND